MFDSLIQQFSFQDIRTKNRLKRMLGGKISSLEEQDERVVNEFYRQIWQHHTVYLDDLTSNRCSYGSNKFIAKEALSMLLGNDRIEQIILSNTTVGVTLDVLNAARKNPHVRRISLQNIALTVAGIKKLAVSMRQISDLIALDFQHIQIISDEGTMMFSEHDDYQALFHLLFENFPKTFPKLRCLRLSHMTFTGLVGQKFLDGLSRLPLSSLNLSNCEFSKGNIVFLCRFIQQSISLKDLILKSLRPEFESVRDSSVSYEVATRHCTLWQEVLYESLMEALPYASTLEYFDFSFNRVQEKDIPTLTKTISLLNLQTLVLRGSLISESSIQLLKNALPSSAILNVDPPLPKDELLVADAPVNLITQNTEQLAKFIRQPQPFECFNFAQCDDFSAITEAFAALLLKALHRDHDTRNRYLLFSRCLADFYAGARSVCSGLVEPSVRNPLNWGADKSFEIALNSIGFFGAATAIIAPLSLVLVGSREALRLNAQAKSRRECVILLSLIEHENAKYLETILPAMVAMIVSSRKESFDNVQLMRQVFSSWKKTALLNMRLDNYLAQRPMLWLMHVLQDLFEASGPAQVNHLIRCAWLRTMREMPTPSLLANELREVQKTTSKLETKIALQERQMQLQEQQIAEQNRKIEYLSSLMRAQIQGYMYAMPGVSGVSYDPFLETVTEEWNEWEEPVRRNRPIPKQFADAMEDEEDGLALSVIR